MRGIKLPRFHKIFPKVKPGEFIERYLNRIDTFPPMNEKKGHYRLVDCHAYIKSLRLMLAI